MPDWLYGFLLWFFGNLIWDFVLAAVVAAVVTWLKSKQSKWATPVLYGISSFAAILVISFVLVGHGLLSREQPQTNMENIEENLKAWTNTYSMGIQKQSDDKFFFTYKVTLQNGTLVWVGRPKDKNKYLNFQSVIMLSPEHNALAEKLTQQQLERVTDYINVEMAKSGMGFAFVRLPSRGMFIARGVPISSNLTETTFIDTLDEMDRGVLLCKETLKIALERESIVTATQSPNARR